MRCQMFAPGDGLPCAHYIRPDDPSQPGFCRLPSHFHCIESYKRKLPALSQSQAKNFLQCRYKYYLSTIQGHQIKPHHLPEAIKLGQAWDLFIQSIYRGEHNDD